MASFSGNIDLLSLSGAKVLVDVDKANKNRPFVCIPLDANEIRVETVKNDPNRQVAKLSPPQLREHSHAFLKIHVKNSGAQAL